MTRDSTSILRPDSLPPALRAVPMLIAARRDEVESETEATYFELLAELCAMRGKEECSQDDSRLLAGAFKQCVLSLLVELDERKIPDGVKLELEGSAAVLLADLASQVGLQDDDAFNLPRGAPPDAQRLPTLIEASQPRGPATEALPPLQQPEGARRLREDLAGKLPRWQARFNYMMAQHNMLLALLPGRPAAQASDSESDSGPDLLELAEDFKAYGVCAPEGHRARHHGHQ